MSEITVRKSLDGSETFGLFFGKHSPFGNFYPAEFELDGVKFNCTEQYFHYKKAELFGDEEMKTAILSTKEPRLHKRYGRQVKNFDAAQWTATCQGFMKGGLMAKFSQNSDLKAKLVETKDLTLVEASPFDRIWGIGLGADNPDAIDRSKWKGKNLLGSTLMEVRKLLLSDS